VRADGEELGGDPDLAAEIGEFDLFALLVDGIEVFSYLKP
jgi:hypothetical protein